MYIGLDNIFKKNKGLPLKSVYGFRNLKKSRKDIRDFDTGELGFPVVTDNHRKVHAQA